jgi:chitodextrinase
MHFSKNFLRAILVIGASFGFGALYVFASTTAPALITGVQATNIMYSGAQIMWTTDDPADSVVLYDTTTASFANTSTSRCDAGGMVTSHCVNLTGLSASMSYYYKVRSTNGAGYVAEQTGTFFSAGASGGDGGGGGGGTDSTPPTPPNYFSTHAVASSQIDLTWYAATDNVGVVGYKIFRNATFVTSVTGLSYADSGLSANTYYSYYVKATDAAGNESSSVYASTTTLPSATPSPSPVSPPSAPTNLLVNGVPTMSSLPLKWNDNSSNEDKWNIERKLATDNSWSLLQQITTANTTTYVDTTVTSGMHYDYRVQACLSGTGCSAYATLTNVSAGESADVTFPTAPTVFNVTAISSAQVALSWSGATDNIGVMGYKVFRNGAYYTGVTSASYTDSNVAPDTSYSYFIQALDAAGNESASSPVKDVRTPSVSTASSSSSTVSPTPSPSPTVADTTLPTPPYQISYTIASSQISFTWGGATDNVGIAGYKIFRNGIYLTTKSTPYCIDSGLLPNTPYSYYIKAFDAAGNESAATQTLSITTLASSTGSALNTTSTPAYPTATTSSSLTTTIATTTTTGTAQSVSATVIRGTSYCDAFTGKTKMTFSVTPSSGAYFKVTKSGGAAAGITFPGTYDLLNGIYYWEAIANPGFVLSGGAYDKFILDKLCTTDGTTTTGTTNTLQTSTATASAYVTLLGDAVAHVPYGGVYIEAGARGYTAEGVLATPRRDLGGLNTSVSGTYKLSYQLFDTLGRVTASAVRTVIVDPPVQITAEPPSVSIQPVTLSSTGVTSSSSAILSFFTQAPAVDTIATPEQYVHYCDDPVHQKECAQYAVKQIAVPEVLPAAPPVSLQVFTTMTESQGMTLPGGATNPEELKAVCGQSTYASSCADLFVTTRVLSREEANEQVDKLLAVRKGEEQVLTERVGARMFQDSDGDGVTDYDEVNIYHTHLQKSDSNNDGILDGQHLLLGTDPLLVTPTVAASTSPKGAATTSQPTVPVLSSKIAYENPQFSGDIKPGLLTVTNVKAVPVNIPEQGTTSPRIALSGKALPNSFVTLFIFSDPIVVTVKADESGAWTYTLDKELPDGTHQVMSAITDGGGHILAKSAPLPFVKEAFAVSIGSPLLSPQAEAPGFFSGGSLYAFIAILISVFALALALIGFIVRRRPSEQVSTHIKVENDNNLFP